MFEVFIFLAHILTRIRFSIEPFRIPFFLYKLRRLNFLKDQYATNGIMYINQDIIF
jgi:hypothetical protein